MNICSFKLSYAEILSATTNVYSLQFSLYAFAALNVKIAIFSRAPLEVYALAPKRALYDM